MRTIYTINDYARDNLQALEIANDIEIYNNNNIPNLDFNLFKNSLCTLEDVHLIMRDISRIKNKYDMLCCGKLIYRLITNSNIISDVLNSDLSKYFSALCSETQSGDEVDNFFLNIHDILGNFEALKRHPFYKKFYRFLLYCTTRGMLDRFGIGLNHIIYSEFERKKVHLEYSSNLDFLSSFLQLLLYVSETGYACFKSNSLEPIFFSSTTAEQWINKSMDLKMKSKVLSNPEPHGFSMPQFFSDLNDAIEKGKALIKFLPKEEKTDRRYLTSLLFDLEIIKSEYITLKAACAERKAPFSLLVYGHSNIGKSLFSQILFKHFGKTFDLPTEAHFKYTVNPLANFWDNFETYMWCLQLDDISSLKPDAVNGIDPSLETVIQAINNVSFVPDQASLDKKGKTPFQGKLVIATTNVQHLNAYAYFSCPIAVRRRFKFIIKLSIKTEFATNGMLDSNKVPIVEGGNYPNLWNIIIEKVLPCDSNIEGQMGMNVEVIRFEDINLFLQWFSQTTTEFEKHQIKAVNCDAQIDEIHVCKECFLNSNICECVQLQSGDFKRRVILNCVLELLRHLELIMAFKLIYYIITIFLRSIHPIFDTIFVFLHGEDYLREFVFSNNRFHVINNYISTCLTRKVNRKINYPYILSVTIGLLTTGYFMISFLKKFKNTFETQGDVSEDSTIKDVGTKPKPGPLEKENMWKDTVEIDPFDIPICAKSLVGKDKMDIVKIFANNCVSLKMTRVENGRILNRYIKAFCIEGNRYITNYHFVRDIDTSFDLEVISSAPNKINSNFTCIMHRKHFVKYSNYFDVCYFNLDNIPPKKSLLKFVNYKQVPQGMNGFYLSRNHSGDIEVRDVKCLNKFAHPQYSDDLLRGHVKIDTIVGDCGSVLCINTPQGWVIAALHTAGSTVDHTVLAIPIYQQHFSLTEVSAGEVRLSAPGYDRVVGELHHKSPANFVEQGTCSVYGSFTGFRPKHKSSVETTIISESLINEGYVLKHGPPVMSGWEPWYIAFKDMVNPNTSMDLEILDRCTESFIQDMLNDFTCEDLEMVHVLDLKTAINGFPGVSFIDSINRQSSMGNPWKKSKQFFLEKDVCDIYPDGVTFAPEILDRIEEIRKSYIRGERANPNFCAHLKDEAISLKKIESKKTRVFTGAPVDWSIVVRMYTLGVTRLFQHRKFISEMAPGTQCQTSEWDDIYKYLTRFGEDRMIAGDYAKFDKRMSSSVILRAFRIIKSICKAAGYNEQELLILDGITKDTAYPLVDFNGDLIQFYGSNPSGHPLTVIINSLVNSLYLRYAYLVLNPSKDVRSFKNNVALMTYGDDNIMGVAKGYDWFNHTALQSVFSDCGIEYTMADKEAASIPFININECSFLKRSWRYEPELGLMVCPLEEDSITKSLLIGVKSKILNREQHCIEKISSAVREYFWYGKEKFEEQSAFLKYIVEKNELTLWVTSSTFPTWEQLITSFKERDDRLKRRCD